MLDRRPRIRHPVIPLPTASSQRHPPPSSPAMRSRLALRTAVTAAVLLTLLVVSTLLSAAAVVRSTGPSSIYSFDVFTPSEEQQQQQQQQQEEQRQQQQQHPLAPVPSHQEEQPQPQPLPGPREQQQQQPEEEGDDDEDDDDDDDEKYFHEAGYTDEQLIHYDARFFRGAVPYGQHRAHLRRLIRSYLTTCRERLGVETWLAHGTLLGWWWGGRIMPWDYDVDAQVSGAALAALARAHNGSLHRYRDRDGNERAGGEGEEEEGEGEEEEGERVYLLDVNPHWSRLDRGKGNNVIDARWIDVETGMFVDITGLVERDPEGQPGVWSCKNFHEYRTSDLYPLRETEFEGVPALVPNEYERILVEEYGVKSLVLTEYEGHRFDPDANEWVRINKTEDEPVSQTSRPI
ncbi:hypothetical protein VTK56DRAFT_7032 [Thermocarpiscus australiensis]